MSGATKRFVGDHMHLVDNGLFTSEPYNFSTLKELQMFWWIIEGCYYSQDLRDQLTYAIFTLTPEY